MGRTLLAATLLLIAISSCKRPGTDRKLNCERYADAIVTRSVECGASEADGIAVSAQNAGEVAKKVAAACEKNEAITPWPDCVKTLKRTECGHSALAGAALEDCRAPSP